MLRYKRITTPTLTSGVETISEILSCSKGKRYRIVSISSYPASLLYLRVYRDAEQIVDIASIDMTIYAPQLPMDLTLDVGQVCKAGFFNNGGATAAKEITVGYKDES